MGLYLLVEKRLRGQRLGNVGLNIDENIQNTDEKRRSHRMGLKAFGPPHAHAHAAAAGFFFTKFGLKKINKSK